MEFFLVLFSLIGVAAASSGATWGYGPSKEGVLGPADWYKGYPHCADSAQSPINIVDASAVSASFEKKLKIDFDKEDGLVEGTLSNNGHAPTLAIDKTKGSAELEGGPLNTKFKLEQIHFHFGCSGNKGSEHTVESRCYPTELHLVFYNNKKYGSFSFAADKPDGLAVVGVLFQKSDSGNEVLGKLTEKLGAIVEEGSSTPITASDQIELEDLIPEIKDDTSYYTYKGSLTTPPCYQSVQWIVLKEKQNISASQLEKFRALKATHGFAHGKMCNNFRPVQPLNGRTVSKV